MKYKTVIIDDGVNDGLIPVPHVTERLMIKEDKICKDTESFNNVSHGTMCSGIIERLHPDSEIMSIRIMNEEGKGNMDSLNSALLWCAENGVKLIHMSLGSTIYDDCENLREVIERLQSNGTIICASMSNLNMPTWPACMKGVFGVRADRNELLDNHEYSFDLSYSSYKENSLVARMDDVIQGETESYPTSMANSYATPLITAKLMYLLDEKPEASFEDALKYLEENSAEERAFDDLFCCWEKREEIKSETPCIWVCEEAFEAVSNYFADDGYVTYSFTNFGKAIPLSIYGIDNIIPRGVIQSFERAYHPDVVIISTKAIPKKDYESFDAYISQNKDGFIVSEYDGKRNCSDINEAINEVVGMYGKDDPN